MARPYNYCIQYDIHNNRRGTTSTNFDYYKSKTDLMSRFNHLERLHKTNGHIFSKPKIFTVHLKSGDKYNGK